MIVFIFCGEDDYHPDKEGRSIKKGALVLAYESEISLPEKNFDKLCCIFYLCLPIIKLCCIFYLCLPIILM